MATLTAARHGVWLLFLCAAPAAARVPHRGHPGSPAGRRTGAGHRAGTAAVSLLGAVVAALVVVGRGESVLPAVPGVVRTVAEVAAGGVVLAEEPLVESLAFHGVRVWVSNPIDAFRAPDQVAYLDFLAGGPGAGEAVSHADVVVVGPHSPTAALLAQDSAFAAPRSVEGWLVYQRLR